MYKNYQGLPQYQAAQNAVGGYLRDTTIFSGLGTAYAGIRRWGRNLISTPANTHNRVSQQMATRGQYFKLKRKKKYSPKKMNKYSPKRFKKSLQRYQFPEIKRATSSLVATTVYPDPGTTVSFIKTFPTPTQGTVATQRIGREIQCYGFTIKGFISQSSTPTESRQYRYCKGVLRIILDVNPNGVSLPTDGTIFDTVSSAQLSNCLIKDIARNKFIILKEIHFELDGVQASGYNFDFFMKKKLTQTFGASTSGEDYGQFMTNGLFLHITVDTNEGSTATNQFISASAKIYTHYIDT